MVSPRRLVSLARRSVAFVRRAGRDVATIAVGPRADGRRRSPALVVDDLRRYAKMARYAAAVRAGRRGDPERALAAADALVAAHPNLWTGLRVLSELGTRRGELTRPAAATERLRAIADNPSLRRRQLVLQGRIVETSPGWIPTIPGSPTSIEPRGPGVVMHLLKASLPDRQSGYTIRSRETLRAQLDAGLEPFAVTPFGYPEPRDAAVAAEAPDVVDVAGVAYHRLSPGSPTDGLRSDQLLERTAVAASVLAARERPALIQAASGHRGYELGLVGAALRRHLRRPLVYEVRGFLETVWTSDLSIAESAELTRGRYAAEARVLAAADGVTTLSATMRDELVSRGVSPDRIVIVPNGIDPDAFAPRPADIDLRRRLGLEGRWVFGYISNLDHPREGQELLIEATARLTRAGRRVACLLVGDGPRRAALEAQARSAGVADAVVFTGRVPFEVVADHYALLDAFVVPRRPDRAARFVTPLKPYEAMASGVPLVVADLPALDEIVGGGTRGLVFPNGEAVGLVAALERLIDDPGLADGLRSGARAWVLAERTWASAGARYRDFYAEVLDRFDPASKTGSLVEPLVESAVRSPAEPSGDLAASEAPGRR